MRYLILGLLSVLGQASTQAETGLKSPQEQRHLGLALAQGLAGRPQAALGSGVF